MFFHHLTRFCKDVNLVQKGTLLIITLQFLSCIEPQQVSLDLNFRRCIEEDGACRAQILEELNGLALAGCLILKTDRDQKFGFKFENQQFVWVNAPYLNNNDLDRDQLNAKMIFLNQKQEMPMSCDDPLISYEMPCGDQESCLISLTQEGISLLTSHIKIDFKGSLERCRFEGAQSLTNLCQHEELSIMDMNTMTSDQGKLDQNMVLFDGKVLDDQSINDMQVDFACVPGTMDFCNGKDDDCDDRIDENATEPVLTTCGYGMCHREVYQNCINGVLQGEECKPNFDLKQDEICNQMDDDCDGMIDNGFDFSRDPNNCGVCNRVCSAQDQKAFTCESGDCQFSGCIENYYSTPGTQNCDVYCESQAERCDGIDNDCDFNIDEEITPIDSVVYQHSFCTGIKQVCENGAWREANQDELSRIPGYGIEICDGVDNDCDGNVDDDVLNLNQNCTDEAKLGICRQGVYQCQQGQLICATNTPQGDVCNGVDESCDGIDGISEQCNGIDDNCDGIVDNYPICAPCSQGGTHPEYCPGVTTNEWVTVLGGNGIATFKMFKTEVTIQMYKNCVNAGGCSIDPLNTCSFAGRDDLNAYPMACVNFDHINQYTAWSGTILPNDLEWEFAAGNRNGYNYPWGWDYNASLANISTGAPTIPCTYAQGNSIDGQICDLIGNVWEFMISSYGAYIRKGGSFYIGNTGYAARASNDVSDDIASSSNRGFRVILRSGF